MPDTPYRYSAFVPSARPVPFDGRTSPGGTLHVEGTVQHSTVAENEMPQVHDSALLVPEWGVEGAISLSPHRLVDIGIRATYAAYAWSQPSAAGTMPLPEHPSLFGIGPEVRFWVPLDHRRMFGIGFAGQMLHYDMPYAAYRGANCTPSTSWFNPTPTCSGPYVLDHTGSEGHFTFSFGLYPSVAFGPDGRYGHFFLVIAGHSAFKNDGFATTYSSGSTINDAGFIPIVGGGYAAKISWVTLRAMTYWPITSSDAPVDYGPGGLLTVGVDLPLWRTRSP